MNILVFALSSNEYKPYLETIVQYNFFQCALYGDVDIVLCGLRAEALKKIVSISKLILCVLINFSKTNWIYKKALRSLYCALENGVDLYVN